MLARCLTTYTLTSWLGVDGGSANIPLPTFEAEVDDVENSDRSVEATTSQTFKIQL